MAKSLLSWVSVFSNPLFPRFDFSERFPEGCLQKEGGEFFEIEFALLPFCDLNLNVDPAGGSWRQLMI